MASAVWHVVDKAASAGDVHACRLCASVWAGTTSTGTIKRHLREHHPRWEELVGPGSGSIVSLSASSAGPCPPSATQRKRARTTMVPYLSATATGNMVRAQLTAWVAAAELPLSVFQNEWCRAALRGLRPGFAAPGAAAVQSQLYTWADTVRQLIRSQLRTLTSNVCLCTDVWSAPQGDQSFVAVTARFIFNWSLCTRLLGVARVHGAHTRTAIRAAITDVLDRYHDTDCHHDTDVPANDCRLLALDRRHVAAFTTDGDRRMGSLFPGQEQCHVVCVAHRLSRFLELALQHDDGTFDKAHLVAQSVRNSKPMLAKLREACGASHATIRLYCRTRWQSALDMVRDLVDKRAHLHPESLEDDEWLVLTEVLLPVLGCVDHATRALSSDAISSSGMALFYVYGVAHKLELCCKLEGARGTYAARMSTKFYSVFAHDDTLGLPRLLVWASLLDPRTCRMGTWSWDTRTHWQQACAETASAFLGAMDDEEEEENHVHVHDRTDNDRESASASQSQSQSQSQSETQSESPSQSSIATRLETHDDEHKREPVATGTTTILSDTQLELFHMWSGGGARTMPSSRAEPSASVQRVIAELKQLHASVPSLALDTDPIAWWHAHRGAYPLLTPFALHVLAVPPTSVSVERVFSTCGRLTRGALRGSLSCSTLDASLMVKHNMDVLRTAVPGLKL